MQEKVQSGQRWKPPSAAAHNATAEATEFYHRHMRLGVPGNFAPGRQSTTVLVRNDSGADITDRFPVLGLDDVVITPTANEGEFLRGPLFSAKKVAIETHYHKTCIAQQPLRDGEIGPAVIDGVTHCKIDVQHADDRWAGPIDDDTGNLISGYGSARILYKESGTGDKWAVVQLGAHAPQRWVPFENGNGAEIPAYGLVLLAEPTDTASGVLKSTASGNAYTRPFAANGPVAVAAGAYGLCTLDFPAWLQYNATGTPDALDIFGSVAGSSVVSCLTTNTTNHNLTPGGFVLLGPNRTTPARGLMQYDQRFLTPEWVRFTLAEDLTTAMQSASANDFNTWGTSAALGNGSLTVWNIPDEENSGSFIFSGTEGATGLAVAQRSASQTLYWIVWIKCAESCG